jgi:hypothetical protein
MGWSSSVSTQPKITSVNMPIVTSTNTKTGTLTDKTNVLDYLEKVKELKWKKVTYRIKNDIVSCKTIPNILKTLTYLNENPSKTSLSKLKDLNKTLLKNEIISLELNKVVSGDKNINFNPEQNISRAEFFWILLDSHCYSFRDLETSKLKFSDLDNKSWQAKVIQKAVDLWLVVWYDDGTVKPNSVISKAEALWVLYKLKILDITEWKIENLNYKDIKVDWEKDLVKNLESVWIIDSKDDDFKFSPDKWVNREFMVKYLIRTIWLY